MSSTQGSRPLICNIENERVLITMQAALTILNKKEHLSIDYFKICSLEDKIKTCEKYINLEDLEIQQEGILIYGKA